MPRFPTKQIQQKLTLRKALLMEPHSCLKPPGTMLYFFVMIDWFSLFINSFWLIGLALLLAGFSYHYWAAQQHQIPLKQQLNRSEFMQLFWVSLIAVCIGLAGTSQRWWETIIWITFIIIGLINLYQLWRGRATNHPEK